MKGFMLVSAEVIEPNEVEGGRVFSVTIGETKYTAKVLRSIPHALASPTNLLYHCFYRVILYAPDGSKVKATNHPQWRTVRKQLLREMLKYDDITGMSTRIARV